METLKKKFLWEAEAHRKIDARDGMRMSPQIYVLNPNPTETLLGGGAFHK